MLVEHIESCLRKADRLESNITPEITQMQGMSGLKTRHFYNNICSMEGARYLEIGVWKGSSLCSAMCGNSMKVVAIDNFSEFSGGVYGNPRGEFLTNFEKYKGDNDATFIDADCWTIDPKSFGTTFNIYMYDGNHTETSHYEALNHYIECLADEFIYLVDDWNCSHIRDGTLNAIKENKLDIVFQKEIFTSGNPGIQQGHNDWHNGISIFVLKSHRTTVSEQQIDNLEKSPELLHS